MIFVFIVMVALAGVAYVLFSSKEALTSIEKGEETGNSYCECHSLSPWFDAHTALSSLHQSIN